PLLGALVARDPRPQLDGERLVVRTLDDVEADDVAGLVLEGRPPGDQGDDVRVDLAPVDGRVQALEAVGGALVDAQVTVRVLLQVLGPGLHLSGEGHLHEAARHDVQATGDGGTAVVDLGNANDLATDGGVADCGHDV